MAAERSAAQGHGHYRFCACGECVPADESSAASAPLREALEGARLALQENDQEDALAFVEAAIAVMQSLEELEAELRQANFFRDKLAERLTLVETAVVELEGALSCAEALDPQHWRDHARHAMASSLSLCQRATKQVPRV